MMEERRGVSSWFALFSIAVARRDISQPLDQDVHVILSIERAKRNPHHSFSRDGVKCLMDAWRTMKPGSCGDPKLHIEQGPHIVGRHPIDVHRYNREVAICALVTINGNGVELFIGTDDENYGGTLRQLPPP